MPSLNIESIGAKKRRCFNRKTARRSMRRRLLGLRKQKEELSKERETIEEVRRRVREKMEAVEEECEQITEETNEIIRQTAMTQIRLALMFNILRARQDGDVAEASHLTQLLRKITVRA
ncbi:uncharacterized protein LOC120153919 [Hibiscus syriacus]|uniref:uncharacterized protein LOC120153919 n=1 Tax=Hibiscus syriacus TaxID=106335 RepID=UPI001923BF0C|nr:uncharacterized protein LOC120153919 [Hibiscus syriacus]